MKFLNHEGITPPPSIFSSIKSGFDTTANQIAIIFLPVLLDLFLWLGPRLQIRNLLRTILAQFEILARDEILPVTDVQRIQESFTELLSLDINLFSVLRTLPIGVSSLMSQALPTSTPVGDFSTYQIESAFVFFFWLISLSFLGWALGGFYFALVAKASIQDNEQTLLWAAKAIGQTVLFSLALIIALIAFGAPLLLLFTIFAQINATLAQIVLIFLLIFAMWIIVPVFFSLHGVFVKKENLFQSLRSSFHLTRFTLPTSSFFVISIIVLSQGFSILWLTPSTSSWMMLISIFGHAFISTSLLAASFIYYRDMNIWLEALLEILESKTTSAQA